MRNKLKILLGIISLFVVGLFWKTKILTANCQITIEEKEVRGSSMEPLIKNGSTIRFLKNYQKCYALQRNDLVIYQYAGHKTPLIKKIRAVAGDSFALKKNKNNLWNILINSEILKNSEDVNYTFSDKEIKMLALYAKDYPVIPKKTYLILGERMNGTMDSSQFGLVSEDDLLGKAEILKNK